MQSKKTILVTGAAGFIGFSLCKKLLEKNYEVVGIDNLNDYYDVKLKQERIKELKSVMGRGGAAAHKGIFQFIKLDFTDFKNLNTKLKKYNFEKIIHLGAQAGVRYSIENPFIYAQTNYIGTLNIFEFAKQNNIPHVLFASTSSVYGKNEKQPFEEFDNTDRPISTYAATKKATEVLAYTYSHLFDIKMTGLRFFTVYGPWGRPDMALFKFIKNILLGKTIDVYNNGDMQRSFTHIDNIVNGIIGTMKIKSKFEIYNFGGGETVKLLDFVKLIEKNLNVKAKINFKKMQDGDVKETVASTKKGEKDFGYKAKTDIEKGIKNSVSWFLENKKWLLKLKDGKQ